MKFVLIPLSVGVPDTINSQMHIIRRTYFTKLNTNGLTPILVSTLHTKEEIEYFYKMSQGLLIMGGTDINPICYGQKVNKNTLTVDHSLDRLEISLAKKAIKDKKPILGICRGCQIINVSQKGSLIQHVPEKYSKNHAVETYEQLGNVKTKITINKNSKLFKITNTSSTIVNCGHHQSVGNVGTNLLVSAISSDDVVEAIEGVGEPFVMGIQSHIETQDTQFSSRIFKAFAKAVL